MYQPASVPRIYRYRLYHILHPARIALPTTHVTVEPSLFFLFFLPSFFDASLNTPCGNRLDDGWTGLDSTPSTELASAYDESRCQPAQDQYSEER